MKIIYVFILFFSSILLLPFCDTKTQNLPDFCCPITQPPDDLKREILRVDSLCKTIPATMNIMEVKKLLGRDEWGSEYQVFDNAERLLGGNKCFERYIISGGRDHKIEVNYTFKQEDLRHRTHTGNDDIIYTIIYWNDIFDGAGWYYDEQVYK